MDSSEATVWDSRDQLSAKITEFSNQWISRAFQCSAENIADTVMGKQPTITALQISLAAAQLQI